MATNKIQLPAIVAKQVFVYNSPMSILVTRR